MSNGTVSSQMAERKLHIMLSDILLTAFYTLVLASHVLSMVIIQRRKTKSQPVKKPTRKLTTSLVITNLIFLTIIFIFVLVQSATSSAWIPSHVLSSTILIYVLSSTWTILLISFDRFIAIKQPLHYQERVNNRTVLFAIVTVYILATLSSTAHFAWMDTSVKPRESNNVIFEPIFNRRLYRTIYVGILMLFGFMLPVLINVYIYASIYRATKYTTAQARKNSVQPLLDEKGNALQPSDGAAILNSSRNSMPIVPRRKTSLQKLSGQLRVHKDNRKCAMMGIYVILTQLILLPYYTALILYSLNIKLLGNYDWVVLVFILIEASVNTFIYILRSHLCPSRRQFIVAEYQTGQTSMHLFHEDFSQ